MGDEHGLTITDLGPCQSCGKHNGMIFCKTNKQGENPKWYIACGYRTCDHKTNIHKELLDAGDEWGLKEMDDE